MSSEEGEQQFLIDGRPVAELKVVELRKELEQRSLPKSGNKKELVDRLVNFLKEEYIEQQRQKTQQFVIEQQLQQQKQERSPTKSPPAPTMPDMVAQYLAQQQIQLEAARRDADKLRASTSSTIETFEEQQLTEMVNQVVGEQQQLATAISGDVLKHEFKNQEQHECGTEFIPEEPTNETVMVQPKNVEQLPEQSLDQQKSDNDGSTSGVQVEASSETEKGYESDTEDEMDEQKSESSSETGKDQQTQPETEHFDESMDDEEKEADGEETANEQAERINKSAEEDQQHLEDEEKQEDTSTEFVPDEPDAHMQVIKKDATNMETLPEQECSEQQNDGLDFVKGGMENLQDEEEEEDEEKEEPDDYGGKRHRRMEQTQLQDSNVSSASGPEHASSGTTKLSFGIESTQNSHQMLSSNEQGETGEQHKLEKDDQSVIQVVANEKPSSPSAQIEISGQSRLSVSAAEESSKPPAAEPETTQDGFIRRRPASPARNPASRWIHIRGLKRPYTQRALYDLLGKFGTVDQSEFWIDSIKSNCIVTFETVEQAQLARERLHNVVWPPASTEALCVEFSSEQKLKRRRADELRDFPALANGLEPSLIADTSVGGLGLTIVVDNRGQDADKDGPRVLIQHEKEHQREAENRKRKAEELEKSQNKLDQLFKKTTTQPSLYYLPLSDAEVVKRHKTTASSSAKQQSNKNSSSSMQHHNRTGSSTTHQHHQHSSSSASTAKHYKTSATNSGGRERDFHRHGVTTTTTSGRSGRR